MIQKFYRINFKVINLKLNVFLTIKKNKIHKNITSNINKIYKLFKIFNLIRIYSLIRIYKLIRILLKNNCRQLLKINCQFLLGIKNLKKIFTAFLIKNRSCVVIDLRLKVNQNKSRKNPHNNINQTLH